MATAGFIVDMDHFGDSDPSTPSLMLPYPAVLYAFLAPVVSSVATAQKPRSRRVQPMSTLSKPPTDTAEERHMCRYGRSNLPLKRAIWSRQLWTRRP